MSSKTKFGSWIKGVWAGMVKPVVKPQLKRWASEKLIPMLQAKVNAGAIDAQVDKVIKTVIEEAVDAL